MAINCISMLTVYTGPVKGWKCSLWILFLSKKSLGSTQRQAGLMTHWPRDRGLFVQSPLFSVSLQVCVHIWHAINRWSTRWRQTHTKLIISGNVRFQHSLDNNHKAIFLLCISSELYMCKHTNIQRQCWNGPFCLLKADEKLPTANFNHIRKMSRRHAVTPTVSLSLPVSPLEFGEGETALSLLWHTV